MNRPGPADHGREDKDTTTPSPAQVGSYADNTYCSNGFYKNPRTIHSPEEEKTVRNHLYTYLLKKEVEELLIKVERLAKDMNENCKSKICKYQLENDRSGDFVCSAIKPTSNYSEHVHDFSIKTKL